MQHQSFTTVELKTLKEKLKSLVKLRSIVVRFLIASIIVGFLSILFTWGIGKAFPSDLGEKELINPIGDDWYLNAFFTFFNRGNLTQPEPFDEIVIFNVVDSIATRSNFAKILRTIAAGHPRVIGMDVYFHENDDTANVELLTALRELKDTTKIVVASYYVDDRGEFKQSFFMSQLDSLTCGVANHPEYTSLDTTYKGIPTFSAQIAKEAGCDLHDVHDMKINYRLKLFNPSFFDDPETLNEDVKDKIVLIGSTENPNDLKNLPFIVKRSSQLPGIEILAYEISTFLSKDRPKNASFSPLVNLCKCGNVVIYLIALATYLLLLYVPKVIFAKCSAVKRLSNLLIGRIFNIIAKTILLMVFEVIIIYACFWYTKNFLLIPNIVLFVISIIFIEEIYDVVPADIDKKVIQKPKYLYEKISNYCRHAK